MAATSELLTQVTSDLNRLTKDKLIQIVITKKFPEGCAVSDAVRKFFEENYPDQNERHHDHMGDQFACDKIQCIRVQADLRVAMVEVNASRRLVQELERSNENLNTIINLLKSEGRCEVRQHDVVKVNSKSSPYEKRRALGPDSGAEAQRSTAALRSAAAVTSQPGNGPRADEQNTRTAGGTAAPNLTASNTVITGNRVAGDDGDVDKHKRKQVYITGTADIENHDNEDFKAAEKMGWIHVARCQQGSTVGGLRRFLESKNPNNEFIVEQVSKTETGNVSFKVGLSYDLLQTVMKEEFWPRGIQVRPFRFRKPQREHRSNRSNAFM